MNDDRRKAMEFARRIVDLEAECDRLASENKSLAGGSGAQVRRVLVWDAKHGSVFWDASTPEKEAEAYLALVAALEGFQAYDGLKGDKTWAEKDLEKLEELKSPPGESLPPEELERLARALRNEKEMERHARESARQRDLFRAAKTGDANAARDLLGARREYEYEDWHFEEVHDPAEDLAKAGLRVTVPLEEGRCRR